MRRAIISAESAGELNEHFENGLWLWLKPSTGVVSEFEGGNWVGKFKLIRVGISIEGLTGEYEGTFKKIKVVNGIITDFELEE